MQIYPLNLHQLDRISLDINREWNMDVP